MNATVGKAIFNAYFFYINIFFVFYNGLKEGSVSLNKCITPNRWVNSGLLLKSSVNPTHTQTISNTQGSSFCEVWESVVQLSTLRSDATLSLFLQLGLPTTWSMCLLLLTPGKAVQVREKLHCCFCAAQDRARTTLYFQKHSLIHPNWIQVFQTL